MIISHVDYDFGRLKSFSRQMYGLSTKANDGGKKMDKEKQKINLSDIKIQQLIKQPIIETNISLSKDKKWIMHTTKITDVKPISYMEKVLGSK